LILLSSKYLFNMLIFICMSDGILLFPGIIYRLYNYFKIYLFLYIFFKINVKVFLFIPQFHILIKYILT
jgi:hypothetical protein